MENRIRLKGNIKQKMSNKNSYFKRRVLRIVIILAALVFYGKYRELDITKTELANIKAENADMEEELNRLTAKLDEIAADAAASADADSGSSAGSVEPEALDEEISDEAEGQYLDGSYEGSGQGFGGMITVQAVIEGGELTELNILDAPGEDSAYLDSATAIIDQIIEAQSAEVDTISGATFSSTGIREAAREALEQAVNE